MSGSFVVVISDDVSVFGGDGARGEAKLLIHLHTWIRDGWSRVVQDDGASPIELWVVTGSCSDVKHVNSSGTILW